MIPVSGIHIYTQRCKQPSSGVVVPCSLQHSLEPTALNQVMTAWVVLVQSNDDRASLSDTCIPFLAYYLYSYPTNISTFVHAILMFLHHARPLEALSRTDTCHNIMLRNIDQLLISAYPTSPEVHSPRIPPPAAAPAPPAGRPCLMYMG